MSKNTGGPAFPSPRFAVPQDLAEQGVLSLGTMQGMTMRQYYKAKAMQGLIVDPDYDGVTGYEIARCAAGIADGMIAEDIEYETRSQED